MMMVMVVVMMVLFRIVYWVVVRCCIVMRHQRCCFRSPVCHSVVYRGYEAIVVASRSSFEYSLPRGR